jgi:hypothetical protein
MESTPVSRASFVAGNHLHRNKSYSVYSIPELHAPCVHNRLGAAFRRNSNNPLREPLRPNRHRPFPAVGVAVDPPDGSGAKYVPDFSFEVSFSVARSLVPERIALTNISNTARELIRLSGSKRKRQYEQQISQ